MRYSLIIKSRLLHGKGSNIAITMTTSYAGCVIKCDGRHTMQLVAVEIIVANMSFVSEMYLCILVVRVMCSLKTLTQ